MDTPAMVDLVPPGTLLTPASPLLSCGYKGGDPWLKSRRRSGGGRRRRSQCIPTGRNIRSRSAKPEGRHRRDPVRPCGPPCPRHHRWQQGSPRQAVLPDPEQQLALLVVVAYAPNCTDDSRDTLFPSVNPLASRAHGRPRREIGLSSSLGRPLLLDREGDAGGEIKRRGRKAYMRIDSLTLSRLS